MLQRLLSIVCVILLARAARAQIVVTVVDDLGSAVAGADVATFEDSIADRVQTDADGRVTLRAAPAARAIRMRVEKPGYAHVDSAWLAQARISLTLRRAAVLEGRVVLAGSGEPVAGAEVRLPHPGCKQCAPEVLTTDAQGRFAWRSAPLGVELEAHASTAAVARQRFALGALAAGPNVERRLELETGHAIHGRVMDFESGAPVAGARVVTVPGALNEATSDADGRFELLAVPESQRQLVRFDVAAPTHCKLAVALTSAEIRPDKELRCPLVRFSAIEGVVLDSAGAPVAGAEVFVREDQSWLQKRRARGAVEPRIPLDDLPASWGVSSGAPNAGTTTDVNGRFRFERVVPWMTELLMHSQHPTAGGVQRIVPSTGAPGTTVEVRFEPARPTPGGRVTGSLKLNGAPVQGVVAWRGPTQSGKIAVDPRGEFEAAGIEPGRVELALEVIQSASVRLTGPNASERATLEVELDRAVRHDFDLRREFAALRGRVVDPRGAPVARVSVGAVDSDQTARAQTVSDAEGRFALDVLALEQGYKLMAIRGPKLIELESARAEADEHVLVVPDLGRLRVRFVDGVTQADLAPAQVLWRAQGASAFEPRPLSLEPMRESGGWFEAEVPLGAHELGAWVARPAYPPSALRSIEVRAGQKLELEFAMREGRPLAVELAADSARPPRDESGRIWVLEAEWCSQKRQHESGDVALSNVALPSLAERFRVLRFDEHGRAQVPGLRPGRYRFVCASAGDAVEPREFELGADDAKPLVLRWRRGP